MPLKYNNNIIRSVAIVSSFKHHSIFSGYKNILRFTKPIKVFGIDYTKENNKLILSHYFIHEFIARINTIINRFDILHILYGEDYFRFSHWLFPRKKLVVTFHQPARILFQELSKGNYNGRVAGFTHSITRNRLRKIDAAIVMTEEQRDIVAQFIDQKRIHVIPLGVELKELNILYKNSNNVIRNKKQVITVGEWQRDWDLYLKIVEYSRKAHPELKFILVNKNIANKLLIRIKSLGNVVYRKDVSVEELNNLYINSLAMFLPLKSSAGSNAINEGLALGCPIISNLYLNQFKNHEDIIYKFSNELDFTLQLDRLKSLEINEIQKISDLCNLSVQEYSWESVSEKLINVYKSILNK